MAKEAPHWPFCALPGLHPDVGVLRLVWGSRKISPLPPPASLVSRYNLSLCHFYTDGTCAHNECPMARHAAWSVVLDCDPTGPPVTILSHWLQHKRIPQSYHVVHQGLTPGSQSIDRAELCALLQVCCDAASMPDVQCTAWTDSQYALDAVERWSAQHCLHGDTVPTNFDLFQAMQVTRKPPNLTLRKIKAHTAPEEAAVSEIRNILGNAAADVAASMARRNEFAFVLDLVEEVCCHHNVQKEAFLLFCRYQQELTRHVASVDARTREAAPGATHTLQGDESL